jgi:regulator of nonsense transcripts 2
MPELHTTQQHQSSIGVSFEGTNVASIGEELAYQPESPWEDEEDQKFHEDLSDLSEFVPKSLLGLHGNVEDDLPRPMQPRSENPHDVESTSADIAVDVESNRDTDRDSVGSGR